MGRAGAVTFDSSPLAMTAGGDGMSADEVLFRLALADLWEPTVARWWEIGVRDASLVRAFNDRPLGVDSVAEYRAAGVPPGKVLAVCRATTPEGVRAFFQEGASVDQIVALGAARVRVSGLRDYLEHGVTIDEAVDLAFAGVGPGDWRRYSDGGLTPRAAIYYSNRRVSAVDMDGFDRLGVPRSEMVAHRAAGLTPRRLRPLLDAGVVDPVEQRRRAKRIGPAMIEAFLDAGVDDLDGIERFAAAAPAKVRARVWAACVTAGVDDHDVVRAIDATNAQAYLIAKCVRHGVVDPAEITSIKPTHAALDDDQFAREVDRMRRTR